MITEKTVVEFELTDQGILIVYKEAGYDVV